MGELGYGVRKRTVDRCHEHESMTSNLYIPRTCVRNACKQVGCDSGHHIVIDLVCVMTISSMVLSDRE